jgi:hypothetical protein
MAKFVPKTVGELLFRAYANLAMAHAAVTDERTKYGVKYYSIRARLYAGLRDGHMNVGSLVEDERLKMVLPQACSYCASRESLSVDHLIASSKAGADTGDNIVWACRSCNSSKGNRDLLEWYEQRGTFPPLYLLRRYLKLAINWSGERNLLTLDLDQISQQQFPFSIDAIPRKYPPPDELQMWVTSLDL